jgi:hypothetical protein
MAYYKHQPSNLVTTLFLIGLAGNRACDLAPAHATLTSPNAPTIGLHPIE